MLIRTTTNTTVYQKGFMKVENPDLKTITKIVCLTEKPLAGMKQAKNDTREITLPGQERAQAQFSEGSGEGMVTMFYPNGRKLFEGLYNGSRFEGKCTWYYPSGAVKHTCTLSNREKIPEESKYKGLMLPDIDDIGREMFWGISVFAGYFANLQHPLTSEIRDELQQLRIIITEPVPEYDDYARDLYSGMDYLMTKVDMAVEAIDKLLKK